MNARMLIGALVLLGAVGAGAFWLMPASVESLPVEGASPASQEVARPSARPPAPLPDGAEFRPPDVTQPLPKRVAPGMGGPTRRGGGVRMAAMEHDYEQTYEPTVDAVEDGVEARAHRIRACADVFGVPNVPPAFPVDDDVDLEGMVAVAVQIDEGEELGQVGVLINGASPGLQDCLQKAVSDMKVNSPESEGLVTQVLIPLDVDDDPG